MDNDRMEMSGEMNSGQDTRQNADILENHSVPQPKPIHIKSLDELNEDMSKYKGMILSFRKDGVIPPPMKSVEEMNQLHEKAPIYYGRSGEKYGADAVLTKEALQNEEIKIDKDGKIQKEEPVETIYKEQEASNFVLQGDLEETGKDLQETEETVKYSINGLNMEYLQSVLEEEEKKENVDMRISRAAYIKSLSEKEAAKKEEGQVNFTDEKTEPVKKMPEESAVILEEKEGITAYKVVKELMTYAVCVVIAIALSFLLVIFVVQKTEVIGDSMNPTLENGQQLVIDKITYRFQEPKRFDVVVFPQGDSKYIKRIIGLPGETVSLEEGYIYINGELLADDTYGAEPIAADNYYRLSSPVTLGEDEYFVMGDNRNNSSDSRDPDVGNVKKEQFIGRAIWRIWPIKEMRILH